MAWTQLPTRITDATRWQRIACPCCGGADFRALFEKGGEPFVQCTGCGLILINPRPDPTDVIRIYDPAYSQGYASKADGKRRRARRMVARVRRLFVPQGRWLDVGCSAGFIVEAAQQAGFEAHGVDVESWGVTYARETLGLAHVTQGHLEEQHYPDGFFNVVSVYEVIEHVPDLNLFAAELKRLLAPGGVIEIRTPDVSHWRVPRPLETWYAVMPSEHLYYFNRATLGRLLARHGLRIVRQRFNLKPGLRVYAGHA